MNGSTATSREWAHNLDNLKKGVLTPDVYDPVLNPLYRDVLAHYGVVALPCRVGDPDRKGKVEAGIGHAQKTPLQGLRFETLETAQAYLDRWETRWADTRIHGTTKRQVAAMFAAEQPALGPVPLGPFRYYQYGVRAPRWLRRSRGRVLRCAARLDRPARRRPVERGDRPGAPPDDRPAAPRTSPRATWLASDRRRRPPSAHPGQDARPPRGGHACRALGRHHLRPHPSARWGRRSPPYPRRPVPREETWPRRCRGGKATAALELGVPTYRFLKRYRDGARPCHSPCARWTRFPDSSRSTAISSIAEQETRHASR